MSTETFVATLSAVSWTNGYSNTEREIVPQSLLHTPSNLVKALVVLLPLASTFSPGATLESQGATLNTLNYLIPYKADLVPTDRKGQSAEWLKDAVDRVNHLSAYSENWDTYGAEPPNSIAINHAMEAINEISRMNFPAPRIMPSVENGVGITYRCGRSSATIEFYNSGEAAAVISDGQSEPEVWEIILSGNVESNRDNIQQSLQRIREFLHV